MLFQSLKISPVNVNTNVNPDVDLVLIWLSIRKSLEKIAVDQNNNARMALWLGRLRRQS
jgi:hypothetical protein